MKTRKRTTIAALLGASATFVVALAIESAVNAEDAAPAAAPAASGTAAPPADAAHAAVPARPPRRSDKPHWAYQPVKHQTVPEVKNKAWVKTPIDAFVLAKLEAQGLTPSKEADRATFIRRATLDTWGYIPSPEEVEAFVADKSPDAYEKLVDRLLASPQYGVRQARRWLDLARYADSTGFENDQTRKDMWRYRDYVVDSFNADKPYDQFIREQIAGDEIDTGDQVGLIATGFMANFPDNHNARDLIDRKYMITTDIVDTVGQVFLAETLQCARCHNHKFDPVSQKDYFSFQAFFANVAEVNDIPVKNIGPIETAYREQQAKYDEATKELRAQQEALIDKYRAETVKYQKERYLEDAQPALFKPEEERTAMDRWIYHRWENVTNGSTYEIDRYLRETADRELAETGVKNEQKLADLEEVRRLDDALGKLNNLKPQTGSDTITAMTDLGHADTPPTFVYFVGDHDQPLEEVQPAFPPAFANGAVPDIEPTATSSGRRLALANWIASPDNPLTARVYVNRIWAQYFGTGIVKSVSNFGIAGDTPTNPELLDYLAEEFTKSGWDVKKIHREILLSAAYRQSSDEREDVASVDPENKLLAVFPRRRLEAEQIRDSLLAAAGVLDTTLGGPSVMPPVPDNLNAGNRWKASKNKADYNRRSLYVFTRRSVAYPLLETFDMASPQQAHSQRQVTTTPLQAMTLYNSDIVFEWSKELAGRVIAEAGPSPEAQVGRLFEILFARAPDKVEQAALLRFLDEHSELLKKEALSDGKFALNEPSGVDPAKVGDPIKASAFVDLVHTVANSNDFSYRF